MAKTTFSGPVLLNPAVVSLTASTSCTQATHAYRVVKLDAAAGLTATLPAATGTGDTYRFVVGTALSSNSYIVQVASATDYFRGQTFMANDTDASVSGFETANSGSVATESDRITMNGTTTGGRVGDVVECIDIGTAVWAVRVFATGSGSEATPFSAAV